jgi:Uma2 family endonuclease
MFFESDDSRLNAIMDDPRAPSMVNELLYRLQIEQQKREKFYQDIDDDMKVEFINGEIIVHSPVKKEHTIAAGYLYKLLDTYVQIHKLGFVGYEKVMISLIRNDYEPDVVYFSPEKAQHFKEGHWKYPAADMAVEVLSKDTKKRDLGIKFQDYALHGIEEYWVIDPIKKTVEQYFLQNGVYELALKINKGEISSKVVKDFSINIAAIFESEAHLDALEKIFKARK